MNLKPAPFALTAATIAAMIGDTGGPSVDLIPVLPVKLVDCPRRSEDPRLARANDNERSL